MELSKAIQLEIERRKDRHNTVEADPEITYLKVKENIIEDILFDEQKGIPLIEQLHQHEMSTSPNDASHLFSITAIIISVCSSFVAISSQVFRDESLLIRGVYSIIFITIITAISSGALLTVKIGLKNDRYISFKIDCIKELIAQRDNAKIKPIHVNITRKHR